MNNVKKQSLVLCCISS